MKDICEELRSHLLEMAETLRFLGEKGSPIGTVNVKPEWARLNNNFSLIQLAWKRIRKGQEELAKAALERIEW